jgi:hypothetical protein
MADKKKQDMGMDMDSFEFNSNYPQPKFETKRNSEWINFGKDNLLTEYLDSLYAGGSPAHATLIDRIATFIAGSGFQDKESDAYLNLNGEDTLDVILADISKDIKKYGAFALKVIWSRDMSTIASVHYEDVAGIRVAAPGVGRYQDTPYYWTSTDWKGYRKDEHIPVLKQGFSDTRKQSRSQILYCKLDGNRNAPYALPAYWSGREYIELQQYIIDFHLRNLRDGTSLKTLVRIDRPAESEEQKTKIKNHFKKFFAEASVGILYDADGIVIENFDAGISDDKFESLDKLTTERIKQAHQIAGKGMLFGMANESGGGGTTFNSTGSDLGEFALTQNLLIRPYQLKLESIFSRLFQTKMEIVPFRLSELQDKDEDNNNLLGPDTAAAPSPNTTTEND